MPEMKTCIVCGGPFRPGKPYQRCCSLSCAGKLRARDVCAKYPGWEDGTYERRVCASCGKPFDRRHRESPGEYYKRLYCSQRCRFVAQRTPEARAAAKARFLEAAEKAVQYHMTKEERQRIQERMRYFLEMNGISPAQTKKLLEEAPPLTPSTE